MVIDASGSVVLFGGLDNHGVPLNDVWRFDTNKMRWSQIACVGALIDEHGHEEIDRSGASGR